ncbi:MAG: helix-turn-helix transcriptional regulator [Chrysiogenetes bacterium]|nr:helix-turn-helix transcriptional regulator [Chrysiogenetes bacterium]
MKTPILGLAHLRKIKGFSQKELAHKTGIVRTTLSRIESGRVRPSLYEVRWIAEALGAGEAEVLASLEPMNAILWVPKCERPSGMEKFLQYRHGTTSDNPSGAI